MDPVAAAALITAVGSFFLGATAELNRRQANKHAEETTRKSGAFQEVLASLEEQRKLIDLYRQENGRQAAEIVAAETKIVAAEAKADAALEAHAACEVKVAALTRKLHEMDARIAELGG